MRLPNGYGSVYKLSGNRRRPWVAVVTTGWTEDGVQQRYIVGYYRTRAEGMQALAEYHEAPIGERRDVTWGQLYEEWSEREYERLSRSTANGYRAVWRRLESLADIPVRTIKSSHLQRVIDDMEREGLSRSSLEKAKTLAGILMERAVNDDIVTTNYARSVKLPPSRRAKRPTFTDMEIRKIERLAADGDVWAGTMLILIYTGMRVGEMLKLTRFSVDVENWVITGGIKTDAGTDRLVPVHSKIRPYIKYWYESNGPRLIHRDGHPISVDYYRSSLYYPTLERAGIDRRLTTHSTRHTFATLLNRAKVNTRHIQELIGHTDYATTANIYTHPHLDELRKAIEAI